MNDFLAVLAAPKKFSGAEVVLTGHLGSEHFEDVALWLSETCYQERHRGHSLALWYDTDDEFEALFDSHGKRIKVTGTIDPEYRGHFGMWPAGIRCSSFVLSGDPTGGNCSTEVSKDYVPGPDDGMRLM